jgi:hypothetical protein
MKPFFSMLFAALVLAGCNAPDSIDLVQGEASASLTATGGCTTLLATTTGDWVLNEAHAFVGESVSDIPQTKNGTFKNGKFPYKAEDLNTTYYAFTIPVTDIVGSVDELCDNTLVVAAHAVVSRDLGGDAGVQEETAWGDGTQMRDDRNWASYFTVKFHCDPETDGGPVASACETAFAVGDSTFIELGLTNSRWGWQLGPLDPGSYETEIYAGAGQNDLSKGTHVGTLFVDYDGTVVTVSYELFPEFELDETHLYLDVVSSNTIAPGQYGYQAGASGQDEQYVVSGFNGESVYIIAHAVVCEE